jgi:YVTN family beta-propeller protein
VVTPDGTKAYVTNSGETSVSVINTQSNTVSATIQVGSQPEGIAMSPDGSVVYTVLGFSSNILIIDTATDAIVGTISYDSPSMLHAGIAIKPDGGRLYVSSPGNPDGDSVSVINPTTRETVAVIPFAANSHPYGLAVTPDGSKVFVANQDLNAPSNVSVINTATNTVTATIPVGGGPTAWGDFIQPLPKFAGTPGLSNCVGKSIAALIQQNGGLNAAAARLGYPSVGALQNAVMAFCGG